MTSPIQPIRVESILVDGRLRKLRESVVAELMESIRQVGLIHPILIRRPDNHLVPHLVAGWHRLEAVRRLGWQEVPCCTLESDDAQAELNEIDENLARADLTPAERAAHVGRRKELYEAAHPETKTGGAPGAGRGRGKRSKVAKLASFQEDNAKKTGRGTRSGRRDAARAKRIPRIADVAGTSLDQGEELDALAKLPVTWQDVLIERAVAGETVTAKAPPEPEPEPEPESEEPMTTLEALRVQAETLATMLPNMARLADDAPVSVRIEVNNLVEVMDLLLLKLNEATREKACAA
jgi:ParB family chromosome partitioning protein